MHEKIPHYSLDLSEYSFSKGKPDFEGPANKIIRLLREKFNDRKVALRFLSSREHPGKSIEDLIKLIIEIGHDRYDEERKGDRYENIDGKKIDFFALDFQVGNEEDEECIRWALESFYDWPLRSGRGPIRVDLGIVYDFSQLVVVEHRYEGRENEVK